jgi:hypothetical protein
MLSGIFVFWAFLLPSHYNPNPVKVAKHFLPGHSLLNPCLLCRGR